MAQFQPIALRALGGVKIAGWAVGRFENGVAQGVVSPLYPSRAQAKAEAERLSAFELNRPGPENQPSVPI